MKHSDTALSVIIPVRNEGPRIVRTVRSILQGRSHPFPLQIVIVDDASHDQSCNLLPALFENVPRATLSLVRLNTWSGIPFARNRGAQAAIHPTFIITDGNTIFPSHWDLPIRRHFHPSRLLAGAIQDISTSFCGYGCTLELPAMTAAWLPDPARHHGRVPVAACTCTVIARSLFHLLGGYDETLPLYGAAEPEFSVRAWLSGYEIFALPDLVIRHRFRPAAEHTAFRASIAPLLLRNYLRFACYYLPEPLLARAYTYYSNLAPDTFHACAAQIQASDVWHHRFRLKDTLPFDFNHLIRTFGRLEPLPIAA